MNSQQKAQIEKCRRAGMGFMDIARQLNIPVTTVKSYCYRHSLPDTANEGSGTLCPQCGQPVPTMRFKPRRFCSDTCRVQYWRQHPDKLKRHTAVESRCAQCGEAFYDYAGRGRKYCSHPCYIAARYGGGQCE